MGIHMWHRFTSRMTTPQESVFRVRNAWNLHMWHRFTSRVTTPQESVFRVIYIFIKTLKKLTDTYEFAD